MLRIYHMPISRSTRVIFAAEELGIPYEIDLRRRSELKRPDVLAINPFGGAPVIEDGELKMMESMAIVEYLVERHDAQHRLAPAPGSPDRAKYLQWLHFAEGSLAPPVIAYLRSSGRWPSTPRDDAALEQARHWIDIGVGLLDDTLAATPYMVGDRVSAADIGIYWVLFIGRFLKAIDLGEWKNVAGYMARLDERPAVKKAMAMPPGYVGEPPGSVPTPARVQRR
jgi:glutathione S-transferase